MKKPLSHEQFAPSRYKPHGRVTVWPEGNIVYLDLNGPFNREFFASLLALNASLYTALKDNGPFVEIATFRSNMLMSADALDEFGLVLSRRKADGCAPLATAWVIGDDVDGAFIILPLAEKKFIQVGRPFRIFQGMDAAEAWARGFLAHGA